MKANGFLLRLAKMNQALFPLRPLDHYRLGMNNLPEAPENKDEEDIEKDGHIPSLQGHSLK